MRVLIFIFTIISIFASQNVAIALTNDHNLSRWVNESYNGKAEVVGQTLETAKRKGILLVPYRDRIDKEDANKQLIKCVDSLAPIFPGYSIGSAMLICSEKMGYINL